MVIHSQRKRGFIWWVVIALIVVLLVSITTWSAGASAKANLAKQYPAPGQLIDVGGYKMHINCIGQGSPTVILEAGLDDFSIFWTRVQPEVKSTRVCAYDRAGLGWSEASSRPRTSAMMVKELHTLLFNAKIEPPYILVGHSFGGVLMQLYTYAFPNEIVGLVLVDAAPVDLFTCIPVWRKLIEQKIGMFRTLASMSSFGLLALAPETIPNRGLPDRALAQYRAIAVATSYFETGIVENEMFERNLAEARDVPMTNFGNLPLVILSRGYWDSLPGISEAENQQAWQEWRKMQSELTMLSSNSQLIIAEKSEHSIQLQQPELVIDAVRQIVDETKPSVAK